MGLKNVHENVKHVHENVKQRVEELRAKKHFVMNRIIFLLIGVGLLLEGLFYLEQQGHIFLPESFIVIAKAIVLIILTFVITAAFIRITEGLFSRLLGKDVEIEQRLFFTKIYAFTLYVGAFAVVLYRLGASASDITLIAGLIATGLAFAVREVLVSFLVWFMLLMKKPFRIGDYIKVGDDMGKVLHIGTFYVIIDGEEDLESEILRIPNKVFLEKNVQNFGPEGVYLDRIRVPFKGMPEDMEQRVHDAQEYLKKSVKGKSTVHIETYKEWVYLVITYPVFYDDRHEMRTKITLQLAKHKAAHAEKHEKPAEKSDKPSDQVLSH